MRIALVDYWPVDPLPMPPAAFGTAAYWRWLSAETLKARG
jgi:hypothetical protein